MRLLAASLFAATLASVTFASAAAAQAQPAANSPAMGDARCLLAMVALSNAEDANAKRLGQGGIIYFTGRVAAREPNFDFSKLRAVAEAMDMKVAQADLKEHCAPMFQKSMQQVETALAPPPGAQTPPPATQTPAKPPAP